MAAACNASSVRGKPGRRSRKRSTQRCQRASAGSVRTGSSVRSDCSPPRGWLSRNCWKPRPRISGRGRAGQSVRRKSPPLWSRDGQQLRWPKWAPTGSARPQTAAWRGPMGTVFGQGTPRPGPLRRSARFAVNSPGPAWSAAGADPLGRLRRTRLGLPAPEKIPTVPSLAWPPKTRRSLDRPATSGRLLPRYGLRPFSDPLVAADYGAALTGTGPQPSNIDRCSQLPPQNHAPDFPRAFASQRQHGRNRGHDGERVARRQPCGHVSSGSAQDRFAGSASRTIPSG